MSAPRWPSSSQAIEFAATVGAVPCLRKKATGACSESRSSKTRCPVAFAHIQACRAWGAPRLLGSRGCSGLAIPLPRKGTPAPTDADDRFDDSRHPHRTLASNASRRPSSGPAYATAAGRGGRVLSANALVSMSVPVGLWRLSLPPRSRHATGLLARYCFARSAVAELTMPMATFRVPPGATSTPPGRPLSDQRGRAARGCGAAEIVRHQQSEGRASRGRFSGVAAVSAHEPWRLLLSGSSDRGRGFPPWWWPLCAPFGHASR